LNKIQNSSATEFLNVRILFVEDNDTVRELIAELLAEQGREVTACSSAEEAEALFARNRFDLLFTDINLPNVSGMELARRLRLKQPDVWVVFSSGANVDHALNEWGPRTRSMIKPFDDADLTQLFADIASADVRI